MKKLRIALISFGALLVLCLGVFLLYIFSPAPKNPNAHLPNSYPLFGQVFNPNTDQNTRMELLPEFLNYNYFEIPQDIQNVQNPDHAIYLDIQIQTKVIHTKVLFMIMEGKKDEALELLLANYHLTWLWGYRERAIDQWIVSQFRKKCVVSLELFLMNCCGSAQDVEELINSLNKTASIIHKPSLGVMQRREAKEYSYQVIKNPYKFVRGNLELHRKFGTWFLPQDVKEAYDGFEFSYKEFYSLLAGAHLRKHYLETGEYPANMDDLENILPTHIYEFFFKQKTSTMMQTNSSHIIKHFSPDKENKYLFPEEGIKTSSKEDFLKHFPNGLPMDIFTANPQEELRLSETEPLYIYSVGPDLQYSGMGAPDYDEELKQPIAYDPTNGLTSKGDIFMFVEK